MMEEHWQRLFALKDHVGLLGDTGRRLGSLKDLLSMSVCVNVCVCVCVCVFVFTSVEMCVCLHVQYCSSVHVCLNVSWYLPMQIPNSSSHC